MAAELGDVVDGWITHNEPWVTAFLGHAEGVKAPGIRDWPTALRVSHHLLLSHGLAVAALRETAPRGHHPQPRAGRDRTTPWPRARMDGYLNRWFLDPVLRGRYPEDMVEHYERRYGPFDCVRDGDLRVDRGADRLPRRQLLHAAARAVRPGAAAARARAACNPAPPTTAMGWEIDADGLHELLVRVRRDYGDVPIYITENGAAFEDGPVVNGTVEDPRRVEYLRSHLDALARGGRRRRRRAALLRLVDARQLRVGARLREALRARLRRLLDPAAGAQAQRPLVPRLHRERTWLASPSPTCRRSSRTGRAPSTGWIWRSPTAASPCWSGRPARASRRRCGWSPGSRRRSSGTIRIADRVVNDVAPKDRDIAMVFQSYALYPHMSVEDNLGFALKMQGTPAESRATRARRGGAPARHQRAAGAPPARS